MIRLRPIFFFFLISSLGLRSQTMEDKFALAEEFFSSGCYAPAMHIYSKLLKKNPDNAALNYRAGICYLYSRSQKLKARPLLEKALKSYEQTGSTPVEKNPALIYRYLADAYYFHYQFDAAIATYKKFRDLCNDSVFEPHRDHVARKVEMCQFGRDLLKKMPLPLSFEPARLTGKNSRIMDSSFLDYSSVVSDDKNHVIFTIKVPLQRLNNPEEDEIYFAEYIHPKNDTVFPKKTNVKKAANGAGIDTIMYATTVGASVDGQAVIVYRNNNGEANLYVSRLKGNTWTEPKRMSKSFNKAGWEENESVSVDGTRMYFVSSRAGGYGGSDIYACDKTDEGSWSKAYNLGPQVNSPLDEVAPFIHPDGRTLYFSSNREKPGSFDIYTIFLTDSANWSKPVNVGYPVNRNDNDIFQVSPSLLKTYASGATGISNTKPLATDSILRADEKNNFMITFMDPMKAPFTIFSGEVNADKKPAGQIKITVTDNLSGKNEGVYYASQNGGSYAFILRQNKSHNITFESDGLLFHSEKAEVYNNIDQYRNYGPIRLQQITPGAVITLNNISFLPARSVIHPASKAELDRLLKLLKDHPALSVELSGYIFTNRYKKLSRRLSGARVRAVADYLERSGIDKRRLAIKYSSTTTPGTRDHQLMELKILEAKKKS